MPQIPRGTVAGIFRHIAEHQPQKFEEAIRRGLEAGGAKSFPFVALGAAYLDGKPIERVMLQADTRLLFVPGAGGQLAAAPDLGADDEEP